MDNYAVKLFESLQKLKVTDENKAEVEKIKQDIRKKDFKKALDRIEKIKNSNVEKKNKELYKNAADVPDDDFFTNDEVKEEANTESQKEDNKEDGYNNDENYDDNYGNDYDDYDEFSEDPLFKKLKAENIHTCIDTSGMVAITEDIKTLLSLTDLVLLDIKHIDPIKSKNLVGFSNERELAFAKYLSDNGIHMWIRQVLIPGYTDDESDLLKLKDFISGLENVDKIEILPYHDMGKYKWKELGLKYELDDVRVANDDDVKRAKKILGIS